MEILFAATKLPIPPNNGHAIRSLSILRALHELGHNVNYVSFSTNESPPELQCLAVFCRDVHVLKFALQNSTQRADILGRLKSLLLCRPYSTERFRSTPMRELIQRELSSRPVDLIICDGLFALANIPDTNVPIVLNCHNVEYIIPRRYAGLEANWFKKNYARLESQLMRSAERKGCHRTACAMVCSQPDLELLRTLRTDLPVSIVPNVVDTDAIRPPENPRSNLGNPVLLFQGVMDWHPNRDAVEFFVRSILPRIRAKYPQVKFVVAGRNPPPEFVAQFSSDPAIKFTGTVPDMRPYLADATVVVVPLRMGGGTRIKILEACASGRPVVSTTIGAEGLELMPGQEILVADAPSEFANLVVSLLSDPLQSETLAKRARAKVEDCYSQPALNKVLGTVISHIR